ncbi:MAG: TetR/AcrR family transcriptional regulator [Ginsengibacter sp.]
MPTTKERILINAKMLFSQNGIANTRLQQIADETQISVGNLAYHFSNKEEIVRDVYGVTLVEISEILEISKIYPSLKSFDAKFSNLYHFMENNVFYFTNFWEIKRNYPIVNGKIMAFNKKIFTKLKKRINDNIERGVFIKEPRKMTYELLANALLNSINTWLPLKLLNDKAIKEKIFRLYLWNLIYPHLTEKGRKEYNSIHF